MRELNFTESQATAGGILCVNGYCVTVPTTGVPSQYYNTLDYAYNQWLNDRISYDQLDTMLAQVPWAYEFQYLNNMNNLFK